MSKKIESEIYPNSPLVEVIFEIRFPGEPVETGKGKMTNDEFQKLMAHGYSVPLWTIPTKNRN